MRILTVHSGNSGFFARFYTALANDLKEKGYMLHYIGPKNSRNIKNSLLGQKLIGSRWNWFIHFYLYKITGLQDVFSFITTIQLLYYIRKYSPNILHFHIIQEWYLNLPLLFWYVKKKNISLVWTMHDCRAFTGRCAYFDEISCEKWKKDCRNCEQKTLYSPSLIDNTNLTFRIRKKILSSVKIQIVCPSEWLSNIVRDSFMRYNNIKTIHNGIDIKDFRYVQSDIRKKYNIEHKFIILGVASIWEMRKGYGVFLRLSNELSEKFQIILVGDTTPDCVENSQIIYIKKTNSVFELSQLYSTSDIFVNPTIADNFPTTNMEAQACGTPVLTYDTGGCSESIKSNTGIIVEKGNYDGLKKAIEHISHNYIFNRDEIINEAKIFDIHVMTKKYIQLYEDINR